MPPHLVIGHRGNAGHAPENTIESFRQAVEIGVDALELDVHLSADGQVVVIHDPTLDRTTDRSGSVERLTVAEIQRADAGARFTRDGGMTLSYRDRGIRVPTLEEVLTTFRATPLIIEIKAPRAGQAARALIERHGAESRCVVASFTAEAMRAFRGSSIRTGATREETARLLVPALARLPISRPPFDVMCIPRYYRGIPLPVGSLVRALRRFEIPVHVWTVDDPDEARMLWRQGVQGVITNEPGEMRALNLALTAER